MSDLLQAWIATALVTALLAAPFVVLAIVSMKRGMRPDPSDDKGAIEGRWPQ